MTKERKKPIMRKHTPEDWWNPHRIIIGFANPERRANLLFNADKGVGKTERKNDHLLLKLEDTSYLILNVFNSKTEKNVQ